HVSQLDDDYYMYLEDAMMLMGKHKHRKFRMGNRMDVKLGAANPTNRQIDLVMPHADLLDAPEADKAKQQAAPKHLKNPLAAKPQQSANGQPQDAKKDAKKDTKADQVDPEQQDRTNAKQSQSHARDTSSGKSNAKQAARDKRDSRDGRSSRNGQAKHDSSKRAKASPEETRAASDATKPPPPPSSAPRASLSKPETSQPRKRRVLVFGEVRVKK
ncbi:MAG: hypothetical protein AAF708_23005, partial [Deinococcota bacterium]